MKILITTLNSKFIHSALSIRYLNRMVENIDGIDVELKEYTINMHIEDIVIDIYKANYDLVVFSTYIWNYNEIKNISKQLKKVSKNIKILLGGPEVSFRSDLELKENPSVDYIIAGEGELTFKEFINALVNNEELNSIKGLTFKDGENITTNKARPLIKDLDIIPFPYDENLEGLDNRIIYYESTRGCPFDCSYCLSSAIKGVRYFSIDRVKEDLKFFLDKKVKQVKFVDRTFNVKKNHYFEIIKFLDENDNGITNFHFEITASLLDDEVVDYLKTVRDGLFQLEIGVQTTNKNTLTEINRGMEFIKINKMLMKVIELRNTHIHLDLIAGLPYEDYNSFLNSFDNVYDLQPNKLQLGFLKILKGSEMKRKSLEYNLVYNDNPPYEIYYNKFITFDEMIKLKGIENLLDLYYNSHYFKNSLNYIINKYYESSSKFYEEFYDYWEINGLFNIKHSKLKQYKILMDFVKKKNEDKIFLEVIKFDYIVNKNKKIDKLFDRIKYNNFRNECHEFLQDKENVEKYLPDFINKSAKHIIKRVHFETFKIDILNYIKSDFNNLIENETIVLFDYSKESNSSRSIYSKIDFRKE